MIRKIGRYEKVFFPELNLKIDSKIDTGAYSISLHVDGIYEKDNKLVFWIENENNMFSYDEFKMINVKSSFGKTQKRYSIKMIMTLGLDSFEVIVSLSDRKDMKFPCLIGRRFLNKNRFLVDVRKKNLHD